VCRKNLGEILSTIEETLGGIRVVKAFNAESQQLRRFKKENHDLFEIKNRAIRRRDLASPVSETLGIIAVSCVLYYGGTLVLNHDFSLNGPDFPYIHRHLYPNHQSAESIQYSVL